MSAGPGVTIDQGKNSTEVNMNAIINIFVVAIAVPFYVAADYLWGLK